MSTDLTILCITAGNDYALPFLEDHKELAGDLQATYVEHWAPDAKTLEHVLDHAVEQCPDGYILRLDDDERASGELEFWLHERRYREHDHWAFPRLNLWPDENSYLANDELYPDLQTRLSVKAKSAGRHTLHAASPFGTGRICQAPIEHWKFIVRSIEERRELLDHYEHDLGAPPTYRAFSVPEDITGLIVVARDPVAA